MGARNGDAAHREAGRQRRDGVLEDHLDLPAQPGAIGAPERPDVAELVNAIEAQTVEDVSGDAIAAEIERFLRDQK